MRRPPGLLVVLALVHGAPCSRVDEAPEAEPRLVETALVELQEETAPWHVVKLFVPLAPDVARHWKEADADDLTARLVPHPGNQPWRLHVWSDAQDHARSIGYDGIHAQVDLPKSADVSACRFEWVEVNALFEPLAVLGPLKALRLTCPIQALRRGGVAGRGSPDLLLLRMFLLWLLLPWPMLMMPRVAQFFFMIGRVCLAGCERHLRARGRVRRFRSLVWRAKRVDGAFGQGEPCCICLGDPARGDVLIALLPCKHTMHDYCYRSWLLNDTYPSRDLVCPLCRCRVEGVGVPASGSGSAPA